MKLRNISTIVGIAIVFVIVAIGHKNYNIPKALIKHCTGYTVIDYDSVEWCDGSRRKYNWHVHYKYSDYLKSQAHKD